MESGKRGRVVRFVRFGRFGFVLGVALAGFSGAGFAQQTGCETGLTVLARAYSYSSPMVVIPDQELERFVNANRSRFHADGDAVRCARAISSWLLSAAISSYDPQFQQQQDELNARMGAMGLSPGAAAGEPVCPRLCASARSRVVRERDAGRREW